MKNQLGGHWPMTMSLPQFLTAAQIAEAVALYKTYGSDLAVAQIQARVIVPNLAAINTKLGQENDPRYLAYVVLYVLTATDDADGAS